MSRKEGWISVDEASPKPDTNVLVCHFDGEKYAIAIGRRTAFTESWYVEGYGFDRPTHWMSTPELPL